MWENAPMTNFTKISLSPENKLCRIKFSLGFSLPHSVPVPTVSVLVIWVGPPVVLVLSALLCFVPSWSKTKRALSQGFKPCWFSRMFISVFWGIHLGLANIVAWIESWLCRVLLLLTSQLEGWWSRALGIHRFVFLPIQRWGGQLMGIERSLNSGVNRVWLLT